MTKDASQDDPDWNALTPPVRDAITAAWRCGMPEAATALYGRWWQIETWLRSLVYVELRAALGAQWTQPLPQKSERRQEKETSVRHMTSADAQARLAYADVGDLLSIIDNHWELFEKSLFEKAIWQGRIAEISHIRNRIGHCRRPHADDLTRLEQMLRDLEPGTFEALASFNRQGRAEKTRPDPLIELWVAAAHPTADRLIQHADRQYETSFELRWSRRPWCQPVPRDSPISGARGYLWHATWYFRGSRWLDLERFWERWQRSGLDEYLDAVIFFCASTSSSLEVSFSALESPTLIADAIGYCFDMVLMELERRDTAYPGYENWSKTYSAIDPRIQAGGPWALLDESMRPTTIFCAYGNGSASPT